MMASAADILLGTVPPVRTRARDRGWPLLVPALVSFHHLWSPAGGNRPLFQIPLHHKSQILQILNH